MLSGELVQHDVASLEPHLPTLGRSVNHAPHSAGQRLNIVRWDQEPVLVVPHNFATAADVGCNNRLATCRCFEQHFGQPFTIVGRQHHDTGSSDRGRHVGTVPPPLDNPFVVPLLQLLGRHSGGTARVGFACQYKASLRGSLFQQAGCFHKLTDPFWPDHARRQHHRGHSQRFGTQLERIGVHSRSGDHLTTVGTHDARFH